MARPIPRITAGRLTIVPQVSTFQPVRPFDHAQSIRSQHFLRIERFQLDQHLCPAFLRIRFRRTTGVIPGPADVVINLARIETD